MFTSQKFRKTKILFTTIAVLGATGYGYLTWRCYNLRKDLTDFELISKKKDSTRPSNEYYGINWGYRSDNTIELSFNTGDILLYDYKCINCLYPSEVVSCYIHKQKSEYTGVGFTFKTPKGLYVIYPHFGKVNISPYSEFLNRPYICKIKARSFLNPPVDITKKTIEFVAAIQKTQKSPDKEISKQKDQDISQESSKFPMKIKNDKIIGQYFHHLGVLRVNPYMKVYDARDLDLDRPNIFHKKYMLDSGFIIRSSTSGDLKDNMNFK
ncbi:unnamed protein product [Moneuplotes crassus]|uniref:Uncharacterized protein n=1 Tax=Euplotes crassus TaxID=5936 RepID=A0AAD1XUL7_EUPCR|nr:unnamed protein product [Moneuplotes crassus]